MTVPPVIGRTFGLLTVVRRGRTGMRRIGGTPSKHKGWTCRCTCGRLITTSLEKLQLGHVFSCNPAGRCWQDLAENPAPKTPKKTRQQREAEARAFAEESHRAYERQVRNLGRTKAEQLREERK